LDDASFNDLVDEIFYDLEDRVDELDLDIDIDSSGGILTFTLPDGSSIIFSRQIGSHEIWVAAKSGGFHLHLADDEWRCGATDEALQVLVNRVFTEQANAAPYA
jgi:CyaY protein